MLNLPASQRFYLRLGQWNKDDSMRPLASHSNLQIMTASFFEAGKGVRRPLACLGSPKMTIDN
jgi:hypothetical protein